MNKKVFVLNGYANSGKNTFCDILNDYIPTIHCSSVDCIKEMAKVVGWRGSKTEKDRKFLSDLKKLVTNYNDYPFKDIAAMVKDFNTELCYDDTWWGADILIYDIREPNEIRRAVEAFNAKTIFIENKNVKQITSNYSDAYVDFYDYDYVIKNNGTLDEFRNEIKEFADQLQKEG